MNPHLITAETLRELLVRNRNNYSAIKNDYRLRIAQSVEREFRFWFTEVVDPIFALQSAIGSPSSNEDDAAQAYRIGFLKYVPIDSNAMSEITTTLMVSKKELLAMSRAELMAQVDKRLFEVARERKAQFGAMLDNLYQELMWSNKLEFEDDDDEEDEMEDDDFDGYEGDTSNDSIDSEDNKEDKVVSCPSPLSQVIFDYQNVDTVEILCEVEVVVAGDTQGGQDEMIRPSQIINAQGDVSGDLEDKAQDEVIRPSPQFFLDYQGDLEADFEGDAQGED